ncbi:MAG: TerC family protein [Planctomycetota bacterium]|jgi:predicted tellurium resistance membrane protein TerC|nr:TerC family protein [Planctomycetales bacterium]RLT11193.1 MAG: TerC family protein [Planctomycetota bacterium]
MSELLTSEALVALLTLTSLEMILGIDNIIFIAILAGRLPAEQRDKGRTFGLLLAVISRVALVLSIGWVMSLKAELFSILGHPFSGRDIILVVGGMFLVFKATREIHHKVQSAGDDDGKPVAQASLRSVLIQVMLIDVVFSLDSVITAVGMTSGLKSAIPVMVIAIILSVLGMLLFSKAIVTFIERNPAIKVLALSFLMLIGMLLIAEGFGKEIPKGYVYFAMAFSFLVEILQMWTEKKSHPPAPESQY